MKLHNIIAHVDSNVLSNKYFGRSLWPGQEVARQDIHSLTSERFYSITWRNVRDLHVYQQQKKNALHILSLPSFKTSFNYHLSYSSVKKLGSRLKRTLKESVPPPDYFNI